MLIVVIVRYQTTRQWLWGVTSGKTTPGLLTPRHETFTLVLVQMTHCWCVSKRQQSSQSRSSSGSATQSSPFRTTSSVIPCSSAGALSRQGNGRHGACEQGVVVNAWAHPRCRGAHLYWDYIKRGVPGSSPLPRAHTLAADGGGYPTGSSPLPRGADATAAGVQPDRGLGDVVGDGLVQGAEGLPDGQRCRGVVGCEQRPEQPVVHLGVERGEALPVRGQDVGVAMFDLDDEAFEFEPPQVVAAAALGVGGGVGSEQRADQRACQMSCVGVAVRS